MSKPTTPVPGFQCSAILATQLFGDVRVTLAVVGPTGSTPAQFRVFSHPEAGRPTAITDRRDPFTRRGELTARAAFASLVSARRRATPVGTPGDDRAIVECDACGHDCYPAELIEGACAACRQLAGLAEMLAPAQVAA